MARLVLVSMTSAGQLVPVGAAGINQASQSILIAIFLAVIEPEHHPKHELHKYQLWVLLILQIPPGVLLLQG